MICFNSFTFQESFKTLAWSIVKVSVMMVGEFEYETNFVDNVNRSSETTGNPLNPFPEISLMFIYFFLFMMSIILMNLLVRMLYLSHSFVLTPAISNSFIRVKTASYHTGGLTILRIKSYLPLMTRYNVTCPIRGPFLNAKFPTTSLARQELHLKSQFIEL